MTLIPFSRSHDGSDCWKMAFLHPISRLKGWILTKLVHLYCWDRDKELIRFWWPWPHFQGHMMAQIVGKWHSCTLSPEWMDGFWLNLYIYIVVTWKKNWLYFGDLDPVFKVTWGLRLLKNVFFWHPFSWRNGWILTKLAQLYCWNRDKNWLDFGDLDPIFKVTLGLRLWKIDHTHAKKKKKKIIDRTFSTIGLFKLVGDICFPLKTLF